MADENAPLPTPLSPPSGSPLHDPPLLNTAASMQAEQDAIKGSKTGLYIVGSLATLLFFGVIMAVVTSDTSSEYGDFGSTVNGMHQSKFNGFWTCALQMPPAELQQVTSNTTMMNELNQRAMTGKMRFLDMVRSDCLNNLTELETSLGELIPPQDLLESRRSMSASVHSLLGGWASLRSYMTRLGSDPYSESDARESIEAITRAWFEYRQAHRSLNQTISGHLGEAN
jgi:hypothetical protein